MSTELITALDDERLTEVRQIVIDVLELDPTELTETSHFVDDHESDSLRAIEILARLEQDLGLEIPQDELENLTTLRNVYEVVARHSTDGDDDA